MLIKKEKKFKLEREKMIRFKNEVFEDYFINPETAIITDKNGVEQETYIINGRMFWRGKPVYQIQMHTHNGFQFSKVIHHIDKNKLNDALTNLIYLTRAEHAKIHHLDKKISEETKNKIRDTLSGRKRSEETKNKIRDTLINKKPSFEMQKIISEKIKNAMTSEVKRKMSNSKKGKIWINNGYLEKCINNINGIPEGFVKGRLKKRPNK